MLTSPAMSDTLPETARGIFADLAKADPRGHRILAKTIYRELRAAGMSERDVLAVATELLAQTAADLKK
jgi:hypothetical protein